MLGEKSNKTDPTFLVVDLFCGAGGTTTGFEMAGGIAKVIACVNHDHTAILSHWANHPDVRHFEEDIRELDLTELIRVVNQQRSSYPNAKLVLWASLECTNHSKAKGGLARDADSRTLANSLHKQWDPFLNDYVQGDSYIQLLNPDYIQIENVVEFLDWGPIRPKYRNGKPVMIKNKHGEIVQGYEPVPELKGVDFKRWCQEVEELGYTGSWNQMNSADFGAYTSRNRLFGIFCAEGLEEAWPQHTHHKSGKNGLKKWMAVKEKLDLSDEGYSIFNRKNNRDIPKRQRKDLVDNTLWRIYNGCIKHVAGGKSAFMVKYHGGKNGLDRSSRLDRPLNVIDTQNRHAFVSVYHGNGDNTHSIDSPCPTIAAADITAAVFLNRNFKTATSSSIEEPAGAITVVPKLDLISVEKMVDSTQYNNIPLPCGTITANRKYPYLLTLQWGGMIRSIDQPCRTILASSGKTPEYLVVTETGDVAIKIEETDSTVVKKLKEFMAMYGIVDIKMRMLKVPELLSIQGFPDSYRLVGTQEDQKKFIGNSVVPQVVKSWTEALHEKILQSKTIAA